MGENDKKRIISRNLAFSLGFLTLMFIGGLANYFAFNPTIDPIKQLRDYYYIPFFLLFIIVFFFVTIIIKNPKEMLKNLFKHTIGKYFFLFLSLVLEVYVVYFLLIDFKPQVWKDWLIWGLLIIASFIAFLFLKYLEETLDNFEISMPKLKTFGHLILFTTILLIIPGGLIYFIYSFFIQDKLAIYFLSLLFASGFFGVLMDTLDKGLFEKLHLIFILISEIGGIFLIAYLLKFNIWFSIISSVVIALLFLVTFFLIRRLPENHKIKTFLFYLKGISQI